jgi:hypothetical protein
MVRNDFTPYPLAWMSLPSFITPTAIPGTSNVFKVSSTRESIWEGVITWAVPGKEMTSNAIEKTRKNFFMLDYLMMGFDISNVKDLNLKNMNAC